MQRVGITKQYIQCFFYWNNSQSSVNILCTWHKTKNIWQLVINRVWPDGGSRTSCNTYHTMQEISRLEILALLVSAYMVSDKISKIPPACKLFVLCNIWGSHSSIAKDSNLWRCYTLSLSSCSHCFTQLYCLHDVRNYLLNNTASHTKRHRSCLCIIPKKA
jgi:hypothetical protein